MRIAFLSEKTINANYRAYFPARELERRGHSVHFSTHSDTPPPVAALSEYDVVVFHRLCVTAMQQTARALWRLGTAVVWDNDDLLGGIPKGHPSYRELGGVRSQALAASIRRMVVLADMVTTPSVLLADRYRKMGAASVRVIENYYPSEFVCGPKRHRGTVIGWTAAKEHVYDAGQLRLRETMQRVLDDHDDVRIVTLGVDLNLDSPRYTHHTWINLETLTQVLAEFDIGIAPIVDAPFNQARSNIKLKEYAAGGVPWLASALGPYANMGSEQGGRLVRNDAWHEGLEQFLADKDQRKKLGANASKWAKTQTIRENIGEWEAALSEAVRRRTAAA